MTENRGFWSKLGRLGVFWGGRGAEFAEASTQREVLTREVAVRHWEQTRNLMSLLPNPDPILRSEGKSIATYRAMKDGHLGAVLRKRRAAVRARPWVLETSGTSARTTKRIQSVLQGLDLRHATSVIWDANPMGYSVLEAIYDVVDGWTVPVALKDKPQEWFGWHADSSFRFMDDTGLGQVVPPYKFLVARNDPTHTNPYGLPLLSECFWPLAFKRGGLRFWMTFLERYGMPRAIGKVPPGTPDDEREALLSMLTGMVRDAAAVINDNESVELQEAKGASASTEGYAGIVHWADSEISKAILGETLSTEMGKVGARAAAEVHNDVRLDLAQDDATLVETEINRLIDWIYDLNAPNETTRVRFKILMPEDLKTGRLERDKGLSEILRPMGYGFSSEYISDSYEIDPKYLVKIPAAQSAAAAAFAEHRHACGGAEFAEAGDADLAALLASFSDQDLQDQVAELVQPILDLAAKGGTFEEFESELDRLFPTLEFSQMQEALAKCLLLAEAKGRSDGAP